MTTGTSRLVKVAAGVAGALMSGGVAWAAAGVVSIPSQHAGIHVADVTTTSTEDTTTTVADTTTTTVSDTTTTTVVDTTTTIPDTTTTTVVDTTTTVPESTTTVPQQCKPGWGYGDKNHCHSGPPGLLKHHAGAKP